MLTYRQIKDLCKYAGEPLAICPLCSSRCSEHVCPALDNVCDGCPSKTQIKRQKRENEQQKRENEEESRRLDSWSVSLNYMLSHYKQLDLAYDENAELVKTTFADFMQGINEGKKKVQEAKKQLKEDLLFIQRFQFEVV
jgi:hypothetical protein